MQGSGLVAKGYGQNANSNVQEQDLKSGRDHHGGDYCHRVLVCWVDLQAQPVPPAYLGDSRPCSLPHRALPWAPESPLLCSPLPFSLTACSSAPALLLVTHPSTWTLWPDSSCAFECIRMCFSPSSSYIFLLGKVLRTLLSEAFLHTNSIQLVIIFGKRAYKKKIKMRWLICNSYSRKFFAETLRPTLQSIKSFFWFSVVPFTCINMHWTLNQALCYQGVIWNRNHEF